MTEVLDSRGQAPAARLRDRLEEGKFEPLSDLCTMSRGDETNHPPVSCACKVLLRLRPSEETERGDEGPLTIGPGEKSVIVGGGAACPVYNMDGVFPPNATQEDVFSAVKENIASVLDGFNCTVLAYGQTWAGKTYTMFGEQGDKRGIIPRALELVYDKISLDKSGAAFICKASMIEIHLEDLRDLLRPGACKLRLRESMFAGVWVEGLHQAFVPTAKSALELVEKGMSRRAAAPTGMNDLSSRSHCIFTLTVECQRQDGVVQSGILRFADLAGLERLDRTQAEGQCLEEAKRINVSLSALGNCISALSQPNRTHIPFRDSKLTFLLKNSLGGNSKTTLLIACSPRWRDLDESVGAIKFGERARAIKSVVRVNRQLKAEELERLLGKLQKDHTALLKYCASLEDQLALSKMDSSVVFEPPTPKQISSDDNIFEDDKENNINFNSTGVGNKSTNTNGANGPSIRTKEGEKKSFFATFLGPHQKESLGLKSPLKAQASPSAAYNIWRRSNAAGQEALSSPLRNMDPMKLLLRIAELESTTVDMQIEIEALSMQRLAGSPVAVAFTSIPAESARNVDLEPSAICEQSPTPTKLEWGIRLGSPIHPIQDDRCLQDAGTQMTPVTSPHERAEQHHVETNTSSASAKRSPALQRAETCAQTSLQSERDESPCLKGPVKTKVLGWLSPSIMPGGDRVESFLGGMPASTQVTPERIEGESRREREEAAAEAVALFQQKFPPVTGRLIKKGLSLLGRSKQVQCELTKDSFLYQSSREGVRKELRLCQVSDLRRDGSTEFSFVFGKRCYVFTASIREERDKWADVLHTRIAHCWNNETKVTPSKIKTFKKSKEGMSAVAVV